MKRTVTGIMLLAGGFALLSAGATLAAENRTDYDYLRQRLAEVYRQIKDLSGKIRLEIGKLPKDTGDANAEKINKLLDGQLGPDAIRSIEAEVERTVGTSRQFAQEMRDKLNEYRRPLDAMDARIAQLEKEYDEWLDKGWEVDMWGYLIKPVGTYGPELRRRYDELAGLRADRKKLLAEVNAKIQADPDFPYRNIEDFQKAVDRAYASYYGLTVAGDNNKAVGPGVKRMLVELSRLVAERSQLEDQFRSGSMYVVWYNDVGWVHVGTAEQFAREKFRARGSEIWGGLGREPLKNTQTLNMKGYTTMDLAVQAVGQAAGKVEFRPSPLASPTSFYTGNVGGDERRIGFEIVRHPAFKPFLPPPPK